MDIRWCFMSFMHKTHFFEPLPRRLTGWYRSSHQVKVGHLWPSAAGGMLIIIDGPKKTLDVILFNFLLEMWEQSLVGNQSNLMTILYFINVTSPLDIATTLLQNPLRLNLHCLVALLKETTLSVRERLTYYRRTAKSPLAEPRSWIWGSDVTARRFQSVEIPTVCILVWKIGKAFLQCISS